MSFMEYIRNVNGLSVLIRLALAVIFGGLIGLERERKHRPAGFRTHVLICLGAAITIPLASFIFGIYLLDTAPSVRSAIQLSSQMGKLRELQTELKDYVAGKREESQERKAERRLEVRERARMLRDSADIFERRLLHSHPDIRKSREDLLAAIRARLNESEAEAKKAAEELLKNEHEA